MSALRPCGCPTGCQAQAESQAERAGGRAPASGPAFPADLRAALQPDLSCWRPLVAHAAGTSEQTSWSLPIAAQAPGDAMSPLMPRLWVLPQFSPGGFLLLHRDPRASPGCRAPGTLGDTTRIT